MRFSIMDFSQAAILKFNLSHPEQKLDTEDLLLLSWIKIFIANTESYRENQNKNKGMWTFDDEEGNRFYNIRYDAILNDLPILAYSSQKSIQRRFDKYVESGLLVKRIINKGRTKGNFTYFNRTSLLISLEYDKTNFEQKINPLESDDKDKEFKNNEEVTQDKTVQSKSVSQDKIVQSLIYNSNTNLNSNTTSSNSNQNNSLSQNQNTNTEVLILSKSSEEAAYLNTIIKLFGYNPGFNPNPYPVLVNAFNAMQVPLDKIPSYLEYIFESLKKTCKNLDKFQSYFYMSFTKEYHISSFYHKQKVLENKKQEQLQNIITCPICGQVHDKTDYKCPSCDFFGEFLSDNYEVNKAKAIYELTQNDSVKLAEYQKAIELNWEQYPIQARLKNKNLQNEFDIKNKEIEKKYLNISIS